MLESERLFEIMKWSWPYSGVAGGSDWGAAGGSAGAIPLAASSDPPLAAPLANGAAAAGGATICWVEVARHGRPAQVLSPPSTADGNGEAATTTAVRGGPATSAGDGSVRANTAVPRGAAGMLVGVATAGGSGGGGRGVVGERDSATASPPPTHSSRSGAPHLPPADASADDRAVAAATELGRVRRGAADASTLVTIYVLEVSRDIRQLRLRGLLADAMGVNAYAVVDADHFDSSTAVTVVTEAAGRQPWLRGQSQPSHRVGTLVGPPPLPLAPSLCRLSPDRSPPLTFQVANVFTYRSTLGSLNGTANNPKTGNILTLG